jgi:chromosome segregation ATPase
MDVAAKAVERISAEISGLKERQNAAREEAERATERLEELEERKAKLTSGAFAGQGGAAEELSVAMARLWEALDEESEALSRTKAHAEQAVQELDRFIVEAEVEYHEAEKHLARKRYEAISEERYALDEEAEEAMFVLLGVLDRLEGLHKKQFRVAEAYNPSLASSQDPRETIENWLARRFSRWLSLESMEKYDAPLAELDPLALKPEPDGVSLRDEGASAPASPEKPKGHMRHLY